MTTDHDVRPPTGSPVAGDAGPPVRPVGASDLRSRIPVLQADLEAARCAERAQSSTRPLQADRLFHARVETLHALVALAEAIEALSWPVPRNLRFEICLRRRLGA